MHRASLLVELLVEELPPKALRSLGEAFAERLAESLRSQGLAAPGAAATAYATPRRLAVHIAGVAQQAAARAVQHKLMPVSVALDAAGQATPALKKKLAALGAADTPLETLRRQGEGKAETLFLAADEAGAALSDGLQIALDEALGRLPIPKVMSYQLADGWSSVKFVRPAHGLVALHGDTVVPVAALGLQAGRQTDGHRFEASRRPLQLRDADSYEPQLREEGAVIAAFDERRALIARQLEAAAAELGLKAVDDAALLDEVTALVERPNVLACEFDAAFLTVPAECLVLTMKANQKYFPLLDAAGGLSNRFLVVSNIKPADAARIVEGNQRVVRPRLADAKFFFDQDRKKTLASRVPALDKVVYHGKLGSLGARVGRVRAIAAAIGAQLGGVALAADAERAALLAKCDLLSDMVGEFPELQGTMGGYYARHDGEHEDVALAIADHYRPRFAGDELPRGDCGVVLALADKLETLVGLFGVGAQPSGDKDPFALRRHAIGVLRLLAERRLPLELTPLLMLAADTFGEAIRFDAGVLLEFLRDRALGLFIEQGFSRAEVEAALAVQGERFDSTLARLQAVRSFAELPEAAALSAANKRIGNILKKSDIGELPPLQPALLVESAEKALAAAIDKVAPRSHAAFAAGDFSASMRSLAALKAPVDTFFDEVMVNADDAALRANRLALLRQLHAAMNRVADLSLLAG